MWSYLEIKAERGVPPSVKQLAKLINDLRLAKETDIMVGNGCN